MTLGRGEVTKAQIFKTSFTSYPLSMMMIMTRQKWYRLRLPIAPFLQAVGTTPMALSSPTILGDAFWINTSDDKNGAKTDSDAPNISRDEPREEEKGRQKQECPQAVAKSERAHSCGAIFEYPEEAEEEKGGAHKQGPNGDCRLRGKVSSTLNRGKSLQALRVRRVDILYWSSTAKMPC